MFQYEEKNQDISDKAIPANVDEWYLCYYAVTYSSTCRDGPNIETYTVQPPYFAILYIVNLRYSRQPHIPQHKVEETGLSYQDLPS